MSIRKWLIVGFFGIVTAGTIATAAQTHMGEGHPGYRDSNWYAVHDTERQAILRHCADDARHSTPDCANAMAGDLKATLYARIRR
jgi:hypothetical protein